MGAGRLEALVSELGSSNGSARLRARETLVAIGEPALDSLVELLGSPEARLRWEAAKALGEIPEPAAVPRLIELLGDSRSEINWLAAVALVNLGSRPVPAMLQVLTSQAGSKMFRQGCHHVFHDLSERNRVLGDILRPVLEVLRDTDPDPAVISARAEVALQAWRALSEG